MKDTFIAKYFKIFLLVVSYLHTEVTEVHSQVVSLFLRNSERKIIRDQDAFILSLSYPMTEFSSVGRFIAVHSSDVNPLTYSIATLKGHGLREESVIKCFAEPYKLKMIT